MTLDDLAPIPFAADEISQEKVCWMSNLHFIFKFMFTNKKNSFLYHRKKHMPERKTETRGHPMTSQRSLHHPHRKKPRQPTRVILRARSHLRRHQVPVRSQNISQMKPKMPHWSARLSTAHTNPRLTTTMMTVLYHDHHCQSATQTLPRGLARPMRRSPAAPVLTVT